MSVLSCDLIERVYRMVYLEVGAMYNRSVNARIMSDEQCVTVELWMARGLLTYTLSVAVFKKDYPQKVEFLRKTIEEICEGDAESSLREAIKDYKKRFKF